MQTIYALINHFWCAACGRKCKTLSDSVCRSCYHSWSKSQKLAK